LVEAIPRLEGKEARFALVFKGERSLEQNRKFQQILDSGRKSLLKKVNRNN
jgi:hypothetical protein